MTHPTPPAYAAYETQTRTNYEFECGPGYRWEQLEALAVPEDHYLPTAPEALGPILDEAYEAVYRAASSQEECDAASRTLDAVEEFALRDYPSRELLDLGRGVWNDEAMRTLRAEIYQLFGIDKRNIDGPVEPGRTSLGDPNDPDNPNDVYILKGQLRPGMPVYLVQSWRGDRCHVAVMDGRAEYADGILGRVNAYSPSEIDLIWKIVSQYETEPAIIQQFGQLLQTGQLSRATAPHFSDLWAVLDRIRNPDAYQASGQILIAEES